MLYPVTGVFEMNAPANQYDLVIVGSGGGSMVAALAAKKLGRSAVILEKQEKVGGSTALSGGVWWVPNNPLMAREGIEDSYDAAMTYLDAAVTNAGPGASRARREAFLRAAPKMVSFLESEGMCFRRPRNWPDYHDDLPGGNAAGRSLMAKNFNILKLGSWANRLATYAPMRSVPLGTDDFPTLFLMKRTLAGKIMALKVAFGVLLNRIIPGREIVANGAAIQGRMLQLALARDVPIFTETTVESLIVEDDRVVGVVARRDGQLISIRATNAVLINAGGFARNAELRRTYQRPPIHSGWTNANKGDTGEVMLAAISLGATTDALDTAVWIATSQHVDGTYPQTQFGPDGTIYPPLHHLDMSLPFLIVVDQDGNRVFNESASYVEVGERIFERQAKTQRAVPSWVIFDARNRARYPWGSQAPGVTPTAWLETGYMRSADRLEDLASQCGINAVQLQKTVERFNNFARSGIDLDFNRGGKAFDRAHGDPTVTPNPNLGAIEQSPFYTVALYPGDVGTSGGLVTDQYARVLKSDGRPIIGLYAAGNIAASLFGRCYPGAGASIAAAFTFGWIGALHALGAQKELSQALAS